jgi:L-gulonate 5-dehydrogenase
MKAGIIESPGILKLTERAKPEIASADGVLIKVKMVGVCGSDIHIMHGSNPFVQYPRVWGHEFAGVVEAVGSSVKNLKAGDIVAGEPIRSCGQCYACRKGRGNVCADLKVMGVHIDGGCQEYLVLPERYAHKLPPGTPWEHAVLVEPFTIGAQTALRGGVEGGDVVLVMGAGTIGQTAMQIAAVNGAEVIITDVVDEKLDYAKASGARHTINAAREDVAAKVAEITDGMGANVVIDAVCTKASFEQAVELASLAGRVVELGFGAERSGIAPLSLTKKEISVCGSRLQTGRFPAVIELLREGKLKLDGFITASYPLEEMSEAFRHAGGGSGEIRKIVIAME